jgi:hypothetical protein
MSRAGPDSTSAHGRGSYGRSAQRVPVGDRARTGRLPQRSRILSIIMRRVCEESANRAMRVGRGRESSAPDSMIWRPRPCLSFYICVGPGSLPLHCGPLPRQISMQCGPPPGQVIVQRNMHAFALACCSAVASVGTLVKCDSMDCLSQFAPCFLSVVHLNAPSDFVGSAAAPGGTFIPFSATRKIAAMAICTPLMVSSLNTSDSPIRQLEKHSCSVHLLALRHGSFVPLVHSTHVQTSVTVCAYRAYACRARRVKRGTHTLSGGMSTA